ncbi:MAG: NAD(P)/FAD-dependent oxidoreductase [Chloroflexota bacterium]|nr:NAD(P)/FAD-dependent oxidoreductase [Chloroflexota bacterium]MDE2931221.1 NAD(P)/FAD-dependent oxidoreductase [Chloroflexota bacterium]
MQGTSRADTSVTYRGGSTLDVVIVGGGPGGLAVSQQLGERSVAHIVIEKGDCPGWQWGQTYDSLRLHTGKHLSALPGMPFPSGTDLFPSRAAFTGYLKSYAERFDIPLRVGVEAHALEREENTWRVKTSEEWIAARAVVVATGIMSSPVVPCFTGLDAYQGGLIHSSAYRHPSGFARQRVLVVGIGNSGAEIATELAAAGASVAVSVRSGVNNVPLSIAGIPSQYLGWAISWLPRAMQQRLTRVFGNVGSLLRGGSPLPRKKGFSDCPDVPLIGMKLANAVESGAIELLPSIERFGPHGAKFADGTERTFDSVILATGYGAALEWMGAYGARDVCGFAKRQDRVRSREFSNLYFIGHNYDGRGGLYNIAVDAKRIARIISQRQRL